MCVCMCVCVPCVCVCTNEWILLLSLSTDSRPTLALQKQNTRESILREIFNPGDNFRGLVTSNVFALSFLRIAQVSEATPINGHVFAYVQIHKFKFGGLIFMERNQSAKTAKIKPQLGH